MPYKQIICGIYAITSPNGSQYIGSSKNILTRWAEHRMHLKRGTHHSERLQAAWSKHGPSMKFTVLLECDRDELSDKEQEHFDRLKPELNTSEFVKNVWANPDTRAKMSITHKSKAWSDARREIAVRSWVGRTIGVECSDGQKFSSMKDAADAFGLSAAGMTFMVREQNVTRVGVRFKRVSDEWRDVLPSRRRAHATMVARGTNVRTPESRAKMSDSAKRRWGNR